MTRPRILVFTASHLCRNPRVIKEATTLGAAGYDVTVLTLSVQGRFERIDREFTESRPFRRVTLDYTAPLRWTRFRYFIQRAATWRARWAIRWLRLESVQALGPAWPLLRMARALPADLTIVHTEIPIWAATRLIRAGRAVAVDVEDWYSEDLMYADRRSRPLKLLKSAERYVLNHARYSTATSEHMADALAAAYQCPRPLVLRNVFPLQPRTRLDRPAGAGPPAFIWFSQTIGPGRGLELFLAAWGRMAAPTPLYLLGDEKPGYRQKLLSLVPPERRELLRFLLLVPPDKLPDKLAEFDIGLALEVPWPLNRDITISNKIFQYMNAGLAVVATNTAGQAEAMQAAPNAGLLVAAHETTIKAQRLTELVTDGPRLRQMQTASRRAAETQFCWEREQYRLLTAVDRALAGAPSR